MAKKRRDSRISFLLERFEDVDSINHKKKGGKKTQYLKRSGERSRVFVGWKAEIPRRNLLPLVVYYKNLS